MKALLKKLGEAKKEMGTISKNGKNPHFKNTYCDINAILEEVEPVLSKHGLLLIQPIRDGVISSVIYDIDTGENIESSIKLPELTEPQKIGSAITYYRRYTLQPLLSLKAEDDDGAKASKPTPKPKEKLTAEGYGYLMSKGTRKEIEKALNERVVSDNQKEGLNKKLESL